MGHHFITTAEIKLETVFLGSVSNIKHSYMSVTESRNSNRYGHVHKSIKATLLIIAKKQRQFKLY